MLNAITGRPGEGKSAYSVRFLIVRELIEGKRPIYTNIGLNHDLIAEYCLSMGAKVDMSRLHYLEEDQIQDFWKHTERVALVILDEVAEFFNAQEWKTIGKEVGSYARLHRHAGHDVYLVVQELGHIFKQFRDLVQYHYEVRNLYTRRFLGVFRFKAFSISKYDMAEGTGNFRRPESTQVFRYNLQIFALYDTHQEYSGTAINDIEESSDYQETELVKSNKRGFGKLMEAIGGNIPGLVGAAFVLGVILFFVFIPGLFMPDKASAQDATQSDHESETIEPLEDSPPPSPDLVESITEATTGTARERRKASRIHTGRYDAATKRSP